jgi:hypothetical protein
MDYTKTELALISYRDNTDFIPDAKIEQFKTALKEEGNYQTLVEALKSFYQYACPKCGERGFYKYHFLGRFSHSKCGCSWFIEPGKYIRVQLDGVMKGAKKSRELTEKENQRRVWTGYYREHPNEREESVFVAFLLSYIVGLFTLVFVVPLQWCIYHLHAPSKRTKTYTHQTFRE